MPNPALAIVAALIPGWTTSADALAARYAPEIVQETRFQDTNRTQDIPVPFDFDGDWNMKNNWENQQRFAGKATPTVHYAAVATKERAYLTYYLYYPRDWDHFCLPFICHENDLEQFTIVVDNDGTKEGKPLLMDVKYHMGGRAYPVTNSGAVPKQQTAAKLSLTSDGRPLVRAEWGGHGITSCDMDGNGVLDKQCADATNEAIVFNPKGHAPTVTGRTTARAYELSDIHDTLWAKRGVGSGVWEKDALDYDGTRLGRQGRSLGVSFAGSGPGGGARAPWGVRPKDGMKGGDRFFDPALALAARWTLPGGADHLPYVEHAYLDDLRAECAGPSCAEAPLVASKK